MGRKKKDAVHDKTTKLHENKIRVKNKEYTQSFITIPKDFIKVMDWKKGATLKISCDYLNKDGIFIKKHKDKENVGSLTNVNSL